MKPGIFALVVLAAVALAGAGAYFFFQSKPPVASMPPGPPATLLVQSDPSGAAVKLDGFPYGVAPVAISPVAPGEHSLEVTAIGGKAKTQVVTIQPGERHSVTVQISP